MYGCFQKAENQIQATGATIAVVALDGFLMVMPLVSCLTLVLRLLVTHSSSLSMVNSRVSFQHSFLYYFFLFGVIIVDSFEDVPFKLPNHSSNKPWQLLLSSDRSLKHRISALYAGGEDFLLKDHRYLLYYYD